MSAAALIRDFEAHGARFELRFDGIHLVRPKGTVLPPELIEGARARKGEIQDALKVSESWTPIPVARAVDAADHAERAAIMEADAGMPREWADTFAAISQASAPGDFTPEQWRKLWVWNDVLLGANTDMKGVYIGMRSVTNGACIVTECE